MRSLLTFLLLVPTSAHAWHVLPPGADAWGASGRRGVRGITVGPIESIQQPDRGYGSEVSTELLDHLVEMGTEWISVTPFGRLWSLSSNEILMDFEAPHLDNRQAVVEMIRQAKARGLRVLLIPHLWVETTGWRGQVEPTDWTAYQASYREFILEWARDARRGGADAFSIGVECKSWSGRFGGYWTDLIASVRTEFDGLLTYSANWDEAEDVLFWDQLDLIGINAFYPLADHDGASDEEYAEGARRVVPQVRELAEVLQMPVLFVEIGYTTRNDAAVEPWLWPDGMENVVVDEREQARALDALMAAFVTEEWFAGFLVWRYYANLDDVSQEAIWGFSPHAKMAEPLLRDAFAAEWAVDPLPWWEAPW